MLSVVMVMMWVVVIHMVIEMPIAVKIDIVVSRRYRDTTHAVTWQMVAGGCNQLLEVASCTWQHQQPGMLQDLLQFDPFVDIYLEATVDKVFHLVR